MPCSSVTSSSSACMTNSTGIVIRFAGSARLFGPEPGLAGDERHADRGAHRHAPVADRPVRTNDVDRLQRVERGRPLWTRLVRAPGSFLPRGVVERPPAGDPVLQPLNPAGPFL